MNYKFYFWNNSFSIISIIVSLLVTFWIYRLNKRLSKKEKFNHEINITKKMREIGIYKSVILANVKKYNPLRKDTTNKTYYKQEAESYTIIPEFGVQVILRPNDNRVPVGLIPFEWIEYIRDYDSENNKTVIVCKFNGIKWYKNFKSPFREINYMLENRNFNEGKDPDFMRLKKNI